MTFSTEGRLSVPGGRVWYGIAGSGARAPLLVVHGGPGAGHDYLEPLERLAGTDRPVVFWDQLGCGRSDAPADPAQYTISRAAAEISAVRAELGLERVHLLGQSLGGWFAIEYLLGRPSGVLSVQLASTSACIGTLMDGIASLRAGLPADARAALEEGEASGDIEGAEYEDAEALFVRRHVCRLDPIPEPLARTIEVTNRSASYPVMWGRNQFMPSGSLNGWDARDRLRTVRLPTLVTCGRHDKFVPACSEELHRGIRGSELRVFERSSHMSHLEEPDEFIALSAGFLERAENPG